MGITEQLEALEIEKQNLKVNGYCGIIPHTFEHNGKTIIIKSISNVGGLLKVIAECNGSETDYNFKNPPILVPDGTFREEIVDGVARQIPNFKEDLLECLHSILGDVIIA